MILYKNSTANFKEQVNRNLITEEIEKIYIEKIGHRPSYSERASWNNSSRFMESIFRMSKIPDDCGILIEYNIPATSKRIDYLITGHDESDRQFLIVVELKQWESASATDKEDLVTTYIGGGINEVTHPSYQAKSYKQYLVDMHSAIYDGDIKAVSCAYLHNYKKKEPEPLLKEQYKKTVDDTPIFFSSDTEKLEDFLRRYVGKGKGMKILYEIENGKIAPSKKLVEHISELFDNNPVFTLLDEQKVAYSNIMDVALKAKGKTAIIVNGGPGTGKSVVAINALVKLLNQGRNNVCFVAPNAAFRTCISNMLAKNEAYDKERIEGIFLGSSKFVYSPNNDFDVIICDEAHRLKTKGSYGYDGESQVKDIIKAARVSIFFIDDNQMIRPNDEGSVSKIIEECNAQNVEVRKIELKSQFRCSGLEGFLNWVDHTLQIEDTANFDGWEKEEFEFKMFDDPGEMYNEISNKCDAGFNARMLAGFAWPWTSEKAGNKNAQINDVIIPEFNFSMPWNSHKNSYDWAINNDKKNQIGCVHTAQGLEFDYIGVIIGKDLQYNPKKFEVYGSYADYRDNVGKGGLKQDPARLTKYIKNIYKILLSRGMKGCYIFCCDKNLAEYIKNRLKTNK